MLTDNRTPAHNSRFAAGGVTCKLEGLCSYLALVQVDSLVLLFPPDRKAAKRYVQLPGDILRPVRGIK